MAKGKGGQQDLFTALGPVKRRLIVSSAEIEADAPDSILFQHTVFCQTGMPYRNPGDDMSLWDKEQGRVALCIQAGPVMDDHTGRWRRIGLPYGPKPRLILAYLNAEALRTRSPEIEVDQSLTAFVKRIGLASKGQNMRIIKDQLARLSAADIRLSIQIETQRRKQIQTHVVSGFDLWFPKDERQRVLWPSIVRLSGDYFASLQEHAVPLDERAISALSHSAMGLDIYCWLAQRLHRIKPNKPAFVPWTALKAQFGWHYGRMDNFKRVFRQTLDMVLTQYRGAKLEVSDKGMTLRTSPPPVKGRIVALPAL